MEMEVFVTDRDLALTGVYQGRPRMTMTYPLLNRARFILWLFTGGEKAPALQRLLKGDALRDTGGFDGVLVGPFEYPSTGSISTAMRKSFPTEGMLPRCNH